jgi:tetratricopeptide (TPR) repeat protein
MKFTALVVAFCGWLFATGCKPNSKDISPLQRKQAASLVSEAQFANTMRDYARAEPLFEKAAKLCPDTGEYWLGLGIARRHQGNKSGAKSAYQEALSAYRDEYERDSKNSEALLRQLYVLALLGRVDDARKTFDAAQKKHPDDRTLRNFVQSGRLDGIQKDPLVLELAL